MPNIYLISLVFSESSRLSLANGVDATHKEELNIRRDSISRYLYQRYSGRGTDSAVGGRVVRWP